MCIKHALIGAYKNMCSSDDMNSLYIVNVHVSAFMVMCVKHCSVHIIGNYLAITYVSQEIHSANHARIISRTSITRQTLRQRPIHR